MEGIDREESVVEWRVSEWQGGSLGRIGTVSHAQVTGNVD